MGSKFFDIPISYFELLEVFMAYFPLFINLKNKDVLVLGGGDVSFQQISMFLVFEARIYLMAEELSQPLEVLAKAYETLMDDEKRATYDRFGEDGLKNAGYSTNGPFDFGFGNLNDIFESFFGSSFGFGQASNPNAPQSGSNDFIFPAIIKRGDVVCGISSSGKSPHVSQFVKSLVESSLPENIGDINEHMDEIRSAVKQSISDPIKRKLAMQAIFTKLIEDDNQTPDYEIDGIIGEAEL